MSDIYEKNIVRRTVSYNYDTKYGWAAAVLIDSKSNKILAVAQVDNIDVDRFTISVTDDMLRIEAK